MFTFIIENTKVPTCTHTKVTSKVKEIAIQRNDNKVQTHKMTDRRLVFNKLIKQSLPAAVVTDYPRKYLTN